MTTKTIIRNYKISGMLKLTFFFSRDIAKGAKQRKDLLDVLMDDQFGFGNRTVHKINDLTWYMELNNYMWDDDNDIFLDLCIKTHQILKRHRYIINKKQYS